VVRNPLPACVIQEKIGEVLARPPRQVKRTMPFGSTGTCSGRPAHRPTMRSLIVALLLNMT